MITITCESSDVASFLREQTDQAERLGSLQERSDRLYEVEAELHNLRARGIVSTGHVSPAAIRGLITAQKNGEKITMIKFAREMTGLGLKDAKDLVEEIIGIFPARVG